MGRERHFTIPLTKKSSSYINFRLSRLQSKEIIRNKMGHYIMLNGSILQEDVIILNVYVSNNRASNHRGQKLIKLQVEIDESTATVGVFNTLLLEMVQFSKQNISKHIVELKTLSINQP